MNRWLCCAILSLFLAIPIAGAQTTGTPASLTQGIQQYRLENYEEAIELLTRARREAPGSSLAAFMLGMAYKSAMRWEKALPNLEDAATLTPRIEEAVMEAARIALAMDDLDRAEKWLDVSRSEKLFPAGTAFLTGRVLQARDRHEAAIRSFSDAALMDPALVPSADFHIALSRVRTGDVVGAVDRLDAVIRADPDSDLAATARHYRDRLKTRILEHRSFRGSLAVFGQYDTNVVLKPSDDDAATDITGEESTALTTSLRADYAPRSDGPWRFNAGYRLFSRLHRNNSDSHDMLLNSITVSPGYRFGDHAVHLLGSYSHIQLRDPGYNAYLNEFRVGPALRSRLGQSALLETAAGYRFRDYAQPPSMTEEDRDSEVFEASMSGYLRIPMDAVLAGGYGFARENTDGENHDNVAHRVFLNAALPAWDRFRFEIGGEALIEDYRNFHTVYHTKRHDRTYEFTAGVSWEMTDAATLIGRYAYTRADSNLAIYDYDRSVYSIGVSYGF